jgi:uncharacterized protein YcfJ
MRSVGKCRLNRRPTTRQVVTLRVYELSTEVVGGWNVYRLGDTEGQVRMDHDPGEPIPVQDREMVLTAT